MRVFAAAAVAIVAAFIVFALLTGQSPAVLLAAAILTLVLGLGHSIMGDKKLITPILEMQGLPAPRGSVRGTRLVLRFGWHLTTLLWCGMAVLLAWMHFVPADLSRPFLWMVAVVFCLCGIIPLASGVSGHTSWVYFFLISALVSYRLWLG